MNLDAALSTFLQECRELLEEIERVALQLERDPADSEAINAMFRAAHTIKGSAGLFGLDGIVSFAHVFESVLDRVRSGDLSIGAELMALLLAACDHLGALVASIEHDQGDGDPALIQRGQELIRGLAGFGQKHKKTNTLVPVKKTGAQQGPVQDAEDKGPVVDNNNWHVSLRFGKDVLRNGMDPMSFIGYLTRLGEIVHVATLLDAIPPAAQMDPESCYLGFEIALHSHAEKKEIEAVFDFVRDDCTLRILPPRAALRHYIQLIQAPANDSQRLGEILVNCGALTERELKAALIQQAQEATQRPVGEILIEQQSVPPEAVDAALGKQREVQEKKAQESKWLRVDAEKLDRLINLVGELVIAGASTSLCAHKRHDSELIESTEGVSRLVEEIRESALRLRMAQVGEAFNRFQRVVRDVSRELNKEIDLVITGGETELDKTMVEKIADPLMHLVRNALDHGIEQTAVRTARGKPARGTLRLHALHDSGHVVIEVSDDGGGLNRAKILQRARERGLVRKDEVPSDQEILMLIFQPGFSTAEKVTDLSGRGVGMDVVKRNIEGLRGGVEVRSREGEGTTIRISLPLTLAIIDGFLVGVGACSYVVPLYTVVECVELPEGERTGAGDRCYLNLRGEVLPFLRLRDELGQRGAPPVRRENVVVVQSGGRKAGLVVDELRGELQTVIKPLGKIFQHLQGISGSTVLGSGEVALILDVPALIHRASSVENRRLAPRPAERALMEQTTLSLS